MTRVFTKEELLHVYSTQTNTELYTKNAIRQYSGDHKRVYRLLLVHYFAASFVSNVEEFRWSQFNIARMYSARRLNDIADLDDEFVKEVKERSISFLCNELKFKIVNSFESELFKSEINDRILSNCVNFLLIYLTKDTRTLFLYSEIEEFWDIDTLYKVHDPTLRVYSNHWIELVPFEFHLPIHTFPEYFAYQDMINIWNDTVDKYVAVKDMVDNNERESREKRYTYNSSLRTSLILGTHFCETYLYYLYYHLRHKAEFIGNKLIGRTDLRNIDDKQIIEKLLFIEFPNLKSIITTHYQKYLETLEYRNAFVHMSAFSENGLSRMQYLVDINMDYVIETLQNIVDMVEEIEANIGDYGILFWKAKMNWPVFNSTHKNSALIK